MALQVWLPMTKDLRQQGLSNTTVTNNGATFNSAGKLGGCYNFTNQNIVVPSNNFKNEFTNNQASLAAWIKVTTSHSAYAQALVLGTQGTSWNNILFGIDINGSGTPIANASTGSAYTNLSFGVAIKDGTWHHIAYTYNAGTMKVYLDGVQKATTTTSNTPAWTSSTNLYIGGNSGGEKFQNGDSMSDVRIYNHCLTPEEVKRIAQGLILHYPLNRNGFGGDNLAKNSNQGWTSTGYNVIQGYMQTDWIEGDTYTITIKGTPSSGCYFGLWRDDGSASFALITTKKAGTDDIWVYTGTCPVGRSGKATNQFSVWDVPSSNTHNCHIDWIKIEKGSISTPWTPAISDTLYTTLGLNGTTEYDCSGFCNNGTRTGTFSWTSDTPKYCVSTKFDGTNYGTFNPIVDTNALNSEMTIAGWVKRTYTDSTERTIFSGPLRLYLHTDFNFRLQWACAKSVSDYTNNVWAPGLLAPVNEWTHIAFTFKDGVVKVYLNGIYKDTSDRTSYGTYILGNKGSSFGSNSTASQFIGNLSDLRLYATALSATDVKSLYQNCATIGPDGTIYGQIRS